MSDRDLLEAAARAGGYKPVRWTDDGTALLLEGVQEPWNALHPNPHSDCMGDALRLAVKLGIDLQLWTLVRDDRSNDKFARAAVTRLCRSFSESESSDPDAATRRAIVRAAAALTQPEGGA